MSSSPQRSGGMMAQRCRRGHVKDVTEDRNDLLEKVEIGPEIGFGVFAKRKISKGTLLCQYRGEMVTEVEFDKDVDMGKRKDDNFVYTLMLKGVCYCVDGGNSEGIGKYINDSPARYANCYIRYVDKISALCIYSKKLIEAGCELRYDYRMLESPWRCSERNLKPLKLNLMNSSLSQESALIGQDIVFSSDDEMYGSESTKIHELVASIVADRELTGTKPSKNPSLDPKLPKNAKLVGALMKQPLITAYDFGPDEMNMEKEVSCEGYEVTKQPTKTASNLDFHRMKEVEASCEEADHDHEVPPIKPSCCGSQMVSINRRNAKLVGALMKRPIRTAYHFDSDKINRDEEANIGRLEVTHQPEEATYYLDSDRMEEDDVNKRSDDEVTQIKPDPNRWEMDSRHPQDAKLEVASIKKRSMTASDFDLNSINKDEEASSKGSEVTKEPAETAYNFDSDRTREDEKASCKGSLVTVQNLGKNRSEIDSKQKNKMLGASLKQCVDTSYNFDSDKINRDGEASNKGSLVTKQKPAKDVSGIDFKKEKRSKLIGTSIKRPSKTRANNFDSDEINRGEGANIERLDTQQPKKATDYLDSDRMEEDEVSKRSDDEVTQIKPIPNRWEMDSRHPQSAKLAVASVKKWAMAAYDFDLNRENKDEEASSEGPEVTKEPTETAYNFDSDKLSEDEVSRFKGSQMTRRNFGKNSKRLKDMVEGSMRKHVGTSYSFDSDKVNSEEEAGIKTLPLTKQKPAKNVSKIDFKKEKRAKLVGSSKKRPKMRANNFDSDEINRDEEANIERLEVTQQAKQATYYLDSDRMEEDEVSERSDDEMTIKPTPNRWEMDSIQPQNAKLAVASIKKSTMVAYDLDLNRVSKDKEASSKGSEVTKEPTETAYDFDSDKLCEDEVSRFKGSPMTQRNLRKDLKQKNMVGDSMKQPVGTSYRSDSDKVTRDEEASVKRSQVTKRKPAKNGSQIHFNKEKRAKLVESSIKRPKTRANNFDLDEINSDKEGSFERAEITQQPTKTAYHLDFNRMEEDEVSCEGSDDETSKNLKHSRSIIVPIATKTKFGGRVYDKELACYFCGKLVRLKISRHIKEVHKFELETYLAKTEHKESTALKLLKKKGNYFHNIEVLKKEKGTLILERRPLSPVSHTEFLPCTKCLGFFLKNELWRHRKSCEKYEKSNNDVEKDFICNGNLLLFSSVNDSYRRVLENVVSEMRKDDVQMVVKNDEMILMYGSYIYERKGIDKKNYIAEKMRNLGKLLIALRVNCNEDKGLKDFISHNYFEAIIKTTKTVSKFGVNKDLERISNVPSLALKLGHALKKCATLKYGMGIKQDNESAMRCSKKFLKLFELHWSNSISSIALRSLGDNKFNKTEQLPLTEDLIKIKSYLMGDMMMLMTKLVAAAGGPDILVKDWRQLAEDTETRILIFNKKRCSEAAKLTVEAYQTKPDWGANQLKDITHSLKPLERILCDRNLLMYVRGKRGKKVPVILTPEVVSAIDILIKTRKDVGISSSNRFIFACPTRQSKNYIRGNDSVAAVVKRCGGLKKPEHVQSIKLRKYTATVSQILSLKEHELDWLARHLGHDIRVHREYYRLHESTIELAKVAKLLMAIDDGKAKNLAGRTLAEIELDDIDVPLLNDEGPINDVPSLNDEEPSFLDSSSAEGESSSRRIKRKIKRKKMSNEEKKVIFKEFKNYLSGKSRKPLPGKSEITKCMETHPNLFKDRPWTNLKDFVRNNRVKTVEPETC